MLDPELKNYLSGINQHLVDLKNKKNPGIWRAFFNGIFAAVGYVVGIAVVVIILGWVLNKTGLLTAFKQELKDFQVFVEQAKKVISVEPSPEQGSGTTITLPDGQQIKVNR